MIYIKKDDNDRYSKNLAVKFSENSFPKNLAEKGRPDRSAAKLSLNLKIMDVGTKISTVLGGAALVGGILAANPIAIVTGGLTLALNRGLRKDIRELKNHFTTANNSAHSSQKKPGDHRQLDTKVVPREVGQPVAPAPQNTFSR